MLKIFKKIFNFFPPVQQELPQELPRIIHRVWLGSVPSEQQIANFLATRVHLEGSAELWLWVSHSIESKFAPNTFDNIIVKNINTLWATPSPGKFSVAHLYSAFVRECYGSLYNYPAASDIARLFILYSYGGIYLDMDVKFRGTKNFKNTEVFDLFGDLDKQGLGTRLGIDTTAQREFSNSVLASRPHTEILERLLKKIINNYSKGVSGRNHSWQLKRTYGETRFHMTLDMTGPNLIINQLNFHELLVMEEIRYFNPIPGDGFYLLNRPKSIRRDSLP